MTHTLGYVYVCDAGELLPENVKKIQKEKKNGKMFKSNLNLT